MSDAGRSGRHPFRYDCSWLIPLGVDELWAVLGDTTAYPDWWPWLRRAELPALQVGGVARFSVVPPLPYRIDVRLLLDQVEPARRIHTIVGGDLDGWATLELTANGGGWTQVRLRSSLAFSRPTLRALTVIGRPVLEWGHQSVVRRGLEGFAAAQGLAAVPGAIEAVACPRRAARRRPATPRRARPHPARRPGCRRRGRGGQRPPLHPLGTPEPDLAAGRQSGGGHPAGPPRPGPRGAGAFGRVLRLGGDPARRAPPASTAWSGA